MALKTPAGVAAPAKNEFEQHLESTPAVGHVSVEKKAAGVKWGGVPNETETVVPGQFDSNGMKVTVEGSHTVNLGNFESAKIVVGVTVPCNPDTLNEAYDFALGWCSERIQAEVKNAKGE